MQSPFVHYFFKVCQLYSGDPTDSIPFLAISIHNGIITFQIPAGGKLEVPAHIAVEFAEGIIDLAKSVRKDDEAI